MTTTEPPVVDLTPKFKARLLARAEALWHDLQQNNLGGYSGINRPFYIHEQFKRVIEDYEASKTNAS